MNSYSHALCDANDELTPLAEASQNGKKAAGDYN